MWMSIGISWGSVHASHVQRHYVRTGKSKNVTGNRLSSFVEYVRSEIPESALSIQNVLGSYFWGCVIAVEQAMLGHGHLALKAEAVSVLSLRSIQDLFAVFHASDIVAKTPVIGDSGCATVLLHGISTLYCKSPSYADGWMKFLHNNMGHERFAERLCYRRYDEISIIMCEKQNDLREIIFWSNVCDDVATWAETVSASRAQ